MMSWGDFLIWYVQHCTFLGWIVFLVVFCVVPVALLWGVLTLFGGL